MRPLIEHAWLAQQPRDSCIDEVRRVLLTAAGAARE
jgi:hypothetical protein